MSNPINLTEVAARKVREIMADKNNVMGIHVSVEPKGCMGLSYVLTLEYETGIDPLIDSVVNEDKGIKIFIDKRAYEFLNGTIIDFADEGLNPRFIFNNPNAKNKCNCGTSFCV